MICSYVRTLIVVVVWPSASLALAAETPCDLAERYYRLAQEAQTDFRDEDAYGFLRRAADSCPKFVYVQELGELAARFGEAEYDGRAAEAFVAAHDLARTDLERARAIGRYGELLFHSDDPQKALVYVVEARNLDPDAPWIADLMQAVSARVANVTEEDIKRGLGDMAFKPLRLQRSLDLDVGPSDGGGTVETTRAINIPLNFKVASTELDAATRNNIDVLASTLIKPDYAGARFRFVGHADVRGDANSNYLLSVSRANAIFQIVKERYPSLGDRIETAGEGERRPLARGNSEEDHRINRRLEVVVVERAKRT